MQMRSNLLNRNDRYLPPAFLVSLVGHAALIASVLLVTQRSSLPMGFQRRGESVYLELGSATIAKPLVERSSKPRDHADGVPTKIKKEKSVEQEVASVSEPQSAARFGVRDGVEGDGELGVANGVEAGARERYLYELTVLLNERKVYPLTSRRMGEAGRVVVKFVILPDGSIERSHVTVPSAHDRLNRAAVDLVNGMRKFKPLSEAFGSSHRPEGFEVEVPIDYVLN